ncbi:SMP-30/gluconolactonase/LRE family protein [Streptomyces spectabilis]|uniref:SMP-30/gluconolactonase/LRE family protein n=1 Tax=Streptomyces spectabilis TaxID=68270 RepID=A0A516R3P9_STRST|nr:SMP-30/gluconolactonase/LRE family protein [Streptomyces spectabilis]QDQ10283.1 SMP-30/gluconolactonase/LRE family protein [Streptomyces spectabilis]
MPILGTSRPRARRAAGSVPPSPLPPLRVLRLPAAGPEDVVVDGAGRVLTGTADGRILRVTLPGPGHGGRVEELARTGGRPLGLEPLPDGRLLVCDAHRGLLRVALEDGGRVEVLAAAVAGEPLRFCSNATAAEDGTVYFTVSSRRYGLGDWRADIVEHVGTGRLLRLAPGGEPEVLLDGLHFANGAALAPDASHVTVAETGARRLVRYWLTGPRAGRSDTFVEDLPGFPDNLSRDEDGTLWVALAGPREPLLDQLHRAPAAVRRAAAAAALRVPVPPRRVLHVMGFSLRGETVHDLARKGAGYRMVTSVAARAGTLVLGSLVEPGIAVCALPPGRA